jgi:deaminated glutathione amidase
MFIASAIQLTSTSREDDNLASAAALIGRAANAGAALVVTPENTNFLGPHADKVGRAEPIGGRVTSFFAELARKHKLHVLLGSYNEKAPETTRCYNTSVLFGPDGDVLGSYRKLHLFDVDVSADVRFKESDTCAPGNDPVVVPTALGTIGLTICYDLRFGELYRKLVDMGAEILTIPSAFTATTGKDHWEVLVRARAIECQSYVIAPGQSGQHDDNGLRHSHGHSLIVDPWGLVIGRASDGPNLALAEVDLERVRKVRRSIPMAQHRRLPG